MFRKSIALMIVLTFSVWVATTTAESQMKVNIVAEAIADAVRDVNRTSGAVVGYFFNRIGGNSVGTRTAPIPTGRLLGKPPVYVTAYTVNYQAKQQSAPPDAVVVATICLVGCGIGCLMMSANNSSSRGSSSGLNDAIDDVIDAISGCSLF